MVIRDGIPGKPGIMRRERQRSDNGIDKCQLHRLFCAERVRVSGTHQCHEGKGNQEHHLGHEDQAAVFLDPRPDFRALTKPGPKAQRSHSQQGEQDPTRVVLEQAKVAH